MKYVGSLLLGLLLQCAAQAQCCNGPQLFVTDGYTPPYAATVFKTGAADVACVNGACLAPAGTGVVVIPQSTLFFAASNPQTLQFRVREFVQVPHTAAIVTTDHYGNEIILNAGISSGVQYYSRGQSLFVK